MKSKPETTTAPDDVLAVVPEQQLLAAIAAAKAERDAYEAQAKMEFNRQMAYYTGRIDALTSLLPPPAVPEPTPVDALPDAAPQ